MLEGHALPNMAQIHALRALRYTNQAGEIATLATLPYDVIPAELEADYRSRSQYNFAHLILPRGDYAGAAARLANWKQAGVLATDAEAAIYVYEQQFPAPGTGEWLTRRGFIALADTEPYGAGVYRHERTLSGPKEDRFRLLEATGVQFDSIFMLYGDPQGDVTAMVDAVCATAPELDYSDHQRTRHRLWRISEAGWIERLKAKMSARKLLIADGHHRYETALRMGQKCTLMTFVALESAGLRSFATHRVVKGLDHFDPAAFLAKLPAVGPGVDPLVSPVGAVRFGVVTAAGEYHTDVPAEAGALNVAVLAEKVLAPVLGITPEVVAAGTRLAYKRSREEAVREVREGRAQIAFLLEDLSIDGMARASFAGAVLPQKSTYFYPKLASGLVMYQL
jgi:uncharacterized protein (DUF1015 family)